MTTQQQLQRDRHLRVVAMSEEEALAFFGLERDRVGEIKTEALPERDRDRYYPGAKVFLLERMPDRTAAGAIVGVVGVWDLMKEADRLTKFYFRPFEFYTASAVIYFVVVFAFARLVGVLERRYSRHVQTEGI